MKINTKCCNKENPVGVVAPSFTWSISEGSATLQTAYELFVYNSRLDWCSGRIDSSDSVRVSPGGLKLEDNTKYYWRVKIYTDAGELTSEESWFITGLAEESTTKWITCDAGISSPLFRKEFYVDKIPEYAVANVCGLGFFELYINGKKVSDDIMQPVRSDYDAIVYSNLPNEFSAVTRKSTYYLSYEVSKYLAKGQNTIVIWLGNGWYRENARLNIRGDFNYGNQLKAFFRLSAENISVEADDTWEYCESPILHNNLFSGEIYDANKFNPAFFESGYRGGNFAEEISAPEASLISQMCPGERAIRRVKPKRVRDDIYDAGEVVSGFASIKLKGKKGERVEILYAEDFDGESLDYTSTVGYVEDDKNQIQKDIYILDAAGVQEYTPRFVWHTYRYIYIKHSENVEISEVVSSFVCTDMKEKVRFDCSSTTLNKIYKMYQNTALSNMHGCTPLDCPHRERLPYTGDGQLSSNAGMYNFDAYEVYKKWIRDINDSQDMQTGFVPYTAPYSGGCGGHAWGSAVVTVPWYFYNQYGDEAFLSESLTYIRRWILYLKGHKDDKGLISRHIEGSWCLGDWVMPSKYPWSDPKPEAIKIPHQLVNTAYYIYCIDILLKVCKVLGIETEPWLMQERSESLSALKRDYVYENGVFGEQDADVYLLFSGAVEGKMAQSAILRLEEKIKNRGYTFNSGMVGLEMLFKVLDKAGRNDIVVRMMTSEEYPSFGNMLKNGATTLWETWEGTGARSHTAFTSIGAWYIYGLSGIKPHGGYKRFTVKPFFVRELDYLKTELETEYGKIIVDWKRDRQKIYLIVTVPFNTTAQLVMPNQETELKCGEHSFVLNEQ